jgi:hypothetical protein
MLVDDSLICVIGYLDLFDPREASNLAQFGFGDHDGG